MAIHYRFGEIINVQTKPGIIFQWPWPIEHIETFKKKNHLFLGKNEQVLTQDQNSLIVSNFAIWSISPDHLTIFKERIENKERFETQLEARIRGLRNGLFGESNFQNLFNSNSGLEKLELQLKTKLKSSCLSDFGVLIHNIGFNHLGLSPDVLESVYEKMNAERQRISSRLKSEGEALSANIIAEAQSQYDSEMAKIDGEVQEILGRAEAESISAYKTLAQHKDLALKLKKLDSLEKLLKGRSTIVLDKNTSPLDLISSSEE
jgi:membrane protease subunit HflC